MIFLTLLLSVILTTTPMFIGYMLKVKHTKYGIIVLFSIISFVILLSYILNFDKIEGTALTTLAIINRLSVFLAIVLWYISLIMSLKK